MFFLLKCFSSPLQIDLVSPTQIKALEARIKSINELAVIQHSTKSNVPVSFA